MSADCFVSQPKSFAWQRLIAFLLVATCGDVAIAQSPSSAAPNGGLAGPGAVTLQQMVEPSYRVQPVVHSFQGVRGETIPFQFQVESHGRPLQCEVRIVSLRQEESGLIMYDDAKEPSNSVRLTSPRQFALQPGSPAEIRGELEIPRTKSAFHSFGLLVRDVGEATKFESSPADKAKNVQAGVRFVTQYVLRCDVEVKDAIVEDPVGLELRDVKLIARDGRPVAAAYLENRGDGIELVRVRGRFVDPYTGREQKPFAWIAPARASVEGMEREIVRILPNSRIRLAAPIDTPLLPGKHTVQLSIETERRRRKLPSVELAVAAGDFPAVAAETTIVNGAVAVSPSQIEVGQARGAKRSSTLSLFNLSSEPQTVRLGMRSVDQAELPGLKLSASEFTLEPGQVRRVSLLVHSQKEITESAVGYVDVAVQGKSASEAKSGLPLSVLYGDRLHAEPVLGEIVLRSVGGKRAFSATVTNRGRGFLPVDAELRLADEQGRSLRLTSGYGRWLAPGATAELDFVTESPLTSGTYQLDLVVRTEPGAQPLGASHVINVPAVETKLSVVERPNAE